MKEYLGEDVYAEIENGCLKLTTKAGAVVMVNRAVYRALMDYLETYSGLIAK